MLSNPPTLPAQVLIKELVSVTFNLSMEGLLKFAKVTSKALESFFG